MTTTQYLDSSLTRQDGPFAGEMLYAKGALCPDGKRRNAWPSGDGVADTFFSIPAFVYVGSTRVYGYVTIETEDGFTVESMRDKHTVKFLPYKYRKNHDLVEPVWTRDTVLAALDAHPEVLWADTGVVLLDGGQPELRFAFAYGRKRSSQHRSLNLTETVAWLESHKVDA